MITLYLYIHTPTHIYFLSFIVHSLTFLFLSLWQQECPTWPHSTICLICRGRFATSSVVFAPLFSWYTLTSSLSSLSVFTCMIINLMNMCYTGECAVHKPVNGGDCEMWPLHKPPLCQFDEGFLHSSPSSCFSLSSRWGSGTYLLCIWSLYLYRHGSL